MCEIELLKIFSFIYELQHENIITPDKRGIQIYFFHISPPKICGYSLKALRQGAYNEYPQYMFSWRNQKKYQYILVDIRSLFGAMKMYHWA